MAISKNPNARTVGGVAAKVAYPALVLLGIGVLLLVLDALGVIDVDDELYLSIIGSAFATLGIGYVSPPALLASTAPPLDRDVA